MSDQLPVLRDVTLQSQSRLLLPQRTVAKSQVSLAPARIGLSQKPAQSSIAMSAIPTPTPGPVRRLQAQSEEGKQGIEDRDYASGYAAGMAAAKGQTVQNERQQVQALAAELTKEQMQKAQASLEQKLQQHAQELQQQWQRKSEQLDLLLRQIPRQVESYFKEAEDDMLALVYDVVCRLLGEEAASLPGLRLQLQRCVKAWHGHAPLSIHLHPDDVALLQRDDESQTFLKSAGFSAERATLRWVADPKVKLGGCLLRSSEGALDARLETQLKALEATLLDTRVSRKHMAMLESPA